MRTVAAAILSLVLVAAAHAEGDANLTVTIHGVTGKGGELRVGLYDEESFAERGAKPLVGQVVPATEGTMTVTFAGIAPGTYGIKAVQDENANGKADMGMFGPTEPIGFSNDAKPKMGPPDFTDAAITLVAGDNATELTLE